MDIEHWRNEIDGLDRELLRLLNMRARLAIKVGGLKKAAALPLCDPVRERHVLGRLQELNAGPLDERAVAKLFRRIIRESRRIEAAALETESIPVLSNGNQPSDRRIS
jgi:chorismate mutase